MTRTCDPDTTVRNVARTIADLAGAKDIGLDDVAEALQFRTVEAG